MAQQQEYKEREEPKPQQAPGQSANGKTLPLAVNEFTIVGYVPGQSVDIRLSSHEVVLSGARSGHSDLLKRFPLRELADICPGVKRPDGSYDIEVGQKRIYDPNALSGSVMERYGKGGIEAELVKKKAR